MMDDEKSFVDTRAWILIVEDDPSHRELIIEAIKEANNNNSTICVNDGEEALRYLKRQGKYKDEQKYPKPDVILLDLKLPGMDGKEVLQKIKNDEDMRSIPVIVLTSSIKTEDVYDCYKLGANSYVTKPVIFGDFFKKVKAIPPYWVMVNTLPLE
jgi:two-component system response regulator